MLRSDRALVALFSALLLLAAYLELRPATLLLLQNNPDYMVTDGGDSLTGAFQARILVDIWDHHPSRLWQPSVFTEKLNYPDGRWLAFTWLERWVLLAGAKLLSVEQAENFLVHVFLVLNFATALWLFRYRKLVWPVALILAGCFALTPFFRARAVVHPAMVGIFLLPLAFLALEKIRQEGRGFQGDVLPAILFLGCGLASQYHVLGLLFFLPVLVWLAFGPAAISRRVRARRLVVCLLPLASLLLYTKLFTVSVPPSFVGEEQARLVGEKYSRLFGAQPVDFLTGDLKISAFDWNPARAWLNSSVVAPSEGTIHERVNGIRWTLLALALGTLAGLLARRQGGWELGVIFVFSLLAFYASLGPEWGSPSILLKWLVPEYRVWNRIGAFAHFGVLLLAAPALEKLWNKIRERAWAPFALLAVFADHLPLAELPVIRLPQETGAPSAGCGAVLALPYVSEIHGVGVFNLVQAGLRRSDCALVNRSGGDDFPYLLRPDFSPPRVACLGTSRIFYWKGRADSKLTPGCTSTFCTLPPAEAAAKNAAKDCWPTNDAAAEPMQKRRDAPQPRGSRPHG